MTEQEFNVLYALHQAGNAAAEDLAKTTGDDAATFRDMLGNLKEQGMVDSGLTEKGEAALQPYKVDNAIIMAAGSGLRGLPLSRYVPKGLFVVKGEVLIERQIEQLKAAGINEIIVVVGYLKEKFYYLKEKYGVIIVENDDYYRYNNMSSLYAAKDYIKRSFICCSDNYFAENVFRDYVYDSYYACQYSKGYADEYFVTKMDGDYIAEIVKGGEDGWYTIGEAFFSEPFSKLFVKYMLEEYDKDDAKKLIMDDFHIKHIDELHFRLYKYPDDLMKEFDSLDDVEAFDPAFAAWKDKVMAEAEPKEVTPIFEKYDNVERYNSATTNQMHGRLHLNENSFGPSDKCFDVLKTITREDLYEYDMSSRDFLLDALAKHFSMPEDDIFIHDGSSEILKSVFAITLERGETVLLPDPGWNYYASLVRENFCSFETYGVLADDYTYSVDMKDLLEKAKKLTPRIIVITSPHNPTGCKVRGKDVEFIVKNNPNSLILLDEAYWGYSEEETDVRRLVECYNNIIISRTFSKYYGLANMRIGFGFCNSSIRHIFGLDLPLFRVNPVSRKMAVAALSDKAYYENITKKICSIREWFVEALNQIPQITAFRSCANFIAARLDGIRTQELKEYLAKEGILIRLFQDGDAMLARITISDRATMEKALALIKGFVETDRKG